MRRRIAGFAIGSAAIVLLFAFFIPIPTPAFYAVPPDLMTLCPNHVYPCPIYLSITAKYLGIGGISQYPSYGIQVGNSYGGAIYYWL